MEDIKKTNQQMNILFDKNKCLQTIHTLQSFYKKEFVINQKQESILWQNAINIWINNNIIFHITYEN